MILKYIHTCIFAQYGQNIFHVVYYLDSYNIHFRRKVRVPHGMALDVTKY